ncbi:MAG: hypothetical protein HUU15_16440, partial [Candidatus Brocadiae bacterium]|nr:hypothetical protein [Candidatus Brocadiia bacterium]
MTDCERLEDAFSEWLDGAGESGNGPLMEAHLAACAACRLRIQEYGEMRRLLRSLEDAPARPPAEILRNVLRVVAPGEVPPSSGTAGGGVEAERAGGPATGAPP